MQTSTTTQHPDDEIDLSQLIAILWDGRWVIVLTTLLSSAFATAYALLTPPTYRAEALVQIRLEPRSGGGLISPLAAQFGGLAGLSDLSSRVGGDRALILATLNSRVVIQAFIQDKKLLPELFEAAWDPVNKRWNVDDPKSEPTLWHGYKIFTESILRVADDKKSGLVTVAVDWRDPETAAAWTTALIAHTNAYLRDEAILESERNLEYLRQQAKQTGIVELQHAVYALQESELKKLMLAKSNDEYAIKTIDPAQAPKQRAKPKRRQIVVIGLLLGGALGVLAVLLKNWVRRQPSPK